MFAPGCYWVPFLIAYLKRSALNIDTDSGNVSFLAMKTGTPISSVVIYGSGDMTLLPP